MSNVVNGQCSTNMPAESEYDRFNNHFRIHELLRRAANILGQIFRERWSLYMSTKSGQTWQNGRTCGSSLWKLCAPKSYIPQKNKNKLGKGKLEKWDVTLVYCAIQVVSDEFQKCGISKSADHIAQDKLIKAVKDLRNDIAHGSSELSNQEFSDYWTKLSNALIGLGDIPSELDELEKKPCVDSRASQWGEEAKKLFQENKFAESIKKYSEILEIPGITPDYQAIIYSNRSEAYLMQKTKDSLSMALRDANWAIKLSPCWWHGYYLLGLVHCESQDWREAFKALNKAFSLNESSSEIKEQLSIVRLQGGIACRQEHLVPEQQPKTLEEQYKMFNLDWFDFSEEQWFEIIKKCENHPILGAVMQGHKYRDGIGVQQDYDEAAKWYSKAAYKGNPEAMYNLGLFYEFGKGVERSIEMSIYWFRKAADTEVAFVGIAEAQHSLGLRYEQGIGVEKDYSKAVEWYKKAVDNNFGASLNNLGLLYQNGLGVERSLTKAYIYFNKAAQRNESSAMINLASCYFLAHGTGSKTPTEKDINLGMEWLRRSRSLGNLHAAMELEKLEKISTWTLLVESFISKAINKHFPKNDPFDHTQFHRKRDLIVSNRRTSAVVKRFKTEGHRHAEITVVEVTPPSIEGLSNITLSEMDASKNKVYDGYMLNVRILDWPLVTIAIQLVVEDENGYIESLSLRSCQWNGPALLLSGETAGKYGHNTC
ncbi:sel1 repeat domain-containing protein [Ditylenchus destructor]|nr:sel1 repeat domain-containing protein [Ditylenchus destructor]